MTFLLHIIISICHWIPTALGYNLVFGKGKIFHFGPLGVSVATSYALYLTLMSTGNWILAVCAGLLMSVLVSLLFSWLALRLEPDGMGVMSIAVHLTMLAVVLNWVSLTRGALGVPKIPRVPGLESIEGFTIVIVIVALLSIFLFLRLEKSAFGRQVDALAEHEWHAKSLGINRAKVFTMCFLILAVTHVIGNFFYPQYVQLLHPNDFQFPSFIFLVMIVIAGKPGSVKGTVLATVLLVVLKEALRFVPLAASLVGPLRLILFGLILFVAVWVRRDTLFPKQRTV